MGCIVEVVLGFVANVVCVVAGGVAVCFVVIIVVAVAVAVVPVCVVVGVGVGVGGVAEDIVEGVL